MANAAVFIPVIGTKILMEGIKNADQEFVHNKVK
jgi:putative Mn2+ efflux pump MntP